MAERKSRYWLLKSEPTSYSFDDLKRDGTTAWTGVRNYQARNTMRDDMKPGDGVLFYHSSTDPTAIVGIAEIVSAGKFDETALDPKDHHCDPKSTPENPIWYAVEVKYKRAFNEPITLAQAKAMKGLEQMVLLQKGSRLSVQPVSAKEWEIISKRK
jgi:predicted RNA-binding protein with PUA-like domain